MATMIERQAASVQKEIEKLTARKVREAVRLEKRIAHAEKLGATCTREEFYAGKRDEYTPEQKWAWVDVVSTREDIVDLERQIANAEKRLAKLTGKVEAVAAKAQEETRITNLETRFLTAEQIEANAKRKEEEYQKWLAEFKAECLKDGIQIDEACSRFFSGKTAGGKVFWMDGNNGWSERSRHCYTLNVAGETVFTSGDFVTAYVYLMNH